ncbi:MAG: low temperature requirement protein A [Microbacteriaceae bacterium]|nr:low temperature requirement protein A [Microbacteriaceae bacterium]
MLGRDPLEQARRATPLELLFDLAFVVAFAQAGNEVAHLVADGRIGAAVGGFLFSAAAICWAWINFAWFASGFDTDDWVFRALTMVQMAGVLVVALGVAPLFESIAHGEALDNGVLVAGYIVMRVAMVAQWLRAAAQSRAFRRTALMNAFSILVAQIGWVVMAVLHLRSVPLLIAFTLVLYAIELTGPIVAKRLWGLPWHSEHIAERYGLLLIITLGEVLLGTITAVTSAVGRVGWSEEAVLLVIAGVLLAFGVWWCYFIVPFSAFIERHRERVWMFGYGHILVFSAVAAFGAGLHVAAYVIEGEAVIGVVGAVLSVTIPLAVFTIAYFTIYSGLMMRIDAFHIGLALGMLAVLGLAVVVAALGWSLGWSLLVAAVAPLVTVIGYETVGYRHVAQDVADLEAA